MRVSRCVFKSGFVFAALYRKDHNQLEKERKREREKERERERERRMEVDGWARFLCALFGS